MPIGRPAHTARPTHQVEQEALRTLLYYDIWEYPLTGTELRRFLRVPSTLSGAEFTTAIHNGHESAIATEGDFYFVKGRNAAIVERRRVRERHARWMWRMARVSAFVIKQFPFVRAVSVSGDLSKNSTGPGSDVDFFIVVEPGRLWIARTLLILFKKIFLFNSRKFFCVNTFVTTRRLTQEDRNVYSATEVAYLKPLFNAELFASYISANGWIKEFFPNFCWESFPPMRIDDRRSPLQYLAEFLLRPFPLDAIDEKLMNRMRQYWASRYPQYDAETQARIFRCERDVSFAYVRNFQDRVLEAYRMKLNQFGLTP